jgi:hypothetical protein
MRSRDKPCRWTVRYYIFIDCGWNAGRSALYHYWIVVMANILRGTVKDASDTPVSGRTVRAYREDTGALIAETETTIYAEAVSGDTHFANVKLLLHGNGSDASTTILDATGKTVTVVGSTQLDTAQKQWGTASILFSGSGDYLTVADSADWIIGSGDFTIELWARWSSNVNAVFVAQDVDANNVWYFRYFASSNRLELSLKSGGTWLIDYYGASWTPTNNTWHHIAVTRNGSTINIFVDGVIKGTTSSSATFPDFSTPLKIGATTNWSAFSTTGWFDDLRFTVGVCRYSADFSASLPSAEFLDTAEVSATALGGYAIDTGAYSGNCTIVFSGETDRNALVLANITPATE